MKRRVLVAVTTALVVIGASSAAVAAPGDRGGGLQSRLDDVVAAGAIGVLAEVRDENGVWRGVSGVAELDATRPVPVAGRFRAGSITKTFLATVVLQLVEAGDLRLDDSVEAWLPGVVPNGDRVTLRHLLNHTSGLYDFKATLPMPPTPEFAANRWRTWTPDELIERALANPPTSETPGRTFSYSNTNYALLGLIVEKVTGESYGDEIKRRVIRPLRLRDTSLPGTSPRIRGPHPHGYLPIRQADGAVVPVDYTEMNPSMLGAGGEIISTTADLNTFVAALLDGTLVSEELLDQMRRPAVDGKAYGLGLAWWDTTCGLRVYGNDGDALTYQSWSFATEDGRRQATLALTPTFPGDPDDAVDAFLNEAFCR